MGVIGQMSQSKNDSPPGRTNFGSTEVHDIGPPEGEEVWGGEGEVVVVVAGFPCPRTHARAHGVLLDPEMGYYSCALPRCPSVFLKSED